MKRKEAVLRSSCPMQQLSKHCTSFVLVEYLGQKELPVELTQDIGGQFCLSQQLSLGKLATLKQYSHVVFFQIHFICSCSF